MSEKNASSLLAVSIMAGMAGAIVALLFAPRSGADTRQKIQERADDLKEHAEEGFNETKKAIGKGLDKFSAAVSSTGQKTKEELEDIKRRNSDKQSPILSAWEEEV